MSSNIYDQVSNIDTGYRPHPAQLDIHKLQGKHRFGVIVAHRRFGKTVCAVNAAINAALHFRKPDGRFAYIAPFYGQAKRVAWDYFKAYSATIKGVRFNESELSITYPNGSVIRLYGADNADSLRGIYLDGVVIDEVADMKPNVWGEVLRPALADRQGWALFIGTPKGINLFYEIYQRALMEDTWFAKIYRADETNMIRPEELAAAKVEMTESQFAQEFMCDFAASNDDILIPVSLAVSATKKQYNDAEVRGSFKVIGVDVARYGDDSSVIIKREGLKIHPPIIFKDISNTDLADAVMREVVDFQPEQVNIDAGRGEGVIDMLKSNRFRVNEINFGGTQGVSKYYRNKRAEMWDNMRKFLQSGGSIPDDAAIVAELATQTFNMNNDVFTLTSKEKMRKDGVKSPDIADAIALTFAVRRQLTNALAKPKKASGGGITTMSNFTNRKK